MKTAACKQHGALCDSPSSYAAPAALPCAHTLFLLFKFEQVCTPFCACVYRHDCQTLVALWGA